MIWMYIQNHYNFLANIYKKLSKCPEIPELLITKDMAILYTLHITLKIAPNSRNYGDNKWIAITLGVKSKCRV